jgi:hypothetical protein
MLRAATDAILAQRLQTIQYLEGRLAALEAMRRKSTRKNVAFWAEALYSAGKDFALLTENAHTIQRAWRAHGCRQKLRYALMSVVKCAACGNRAQVPRKSMRSPPFFMLVPKFRCASCRRVIVTALHPLWIDYVGPQSLYVGGGDVGGANNSTRGIINKRRQEAAARHLQKRLHQALAGAGVSADKSAAAEAKLLTFTGFWQPQHVEDMLEGSPLSFARGVNMRTGIQLDESATALELEAEKIKEPSAAVADLNEEHDEEVNEAAARSREAATMAKEGEEAVYLAAAGNARMLSRLARFKAHASQVGLVRVNRKNIRAAKWQGLTTLVLNQRDIEAAKKKLKEELEAAQASRDAALQQAQQVEPVASAAVEPEDPVTPPEPEVKYPKGSLVRAGLPEWGDDKYPGKIHIVNDNNTYGVIFDVRVSFLSCFCLFFPYFFPVFLQNRPALY